MTLRELKAQINAIPDGELDQTARFVDGAEIDYDSDERPLYHEVDDNDEIDGLTKVYDSDADAEVWVFHS